MTIRQRQIQSQFTGRCISLRIPWAETPFWGDSWDLFYLTHLGSLSAIIHRPWGGERDALRSGAPDPDPGPCHPSRGPSLGLGVVHAEKRRWVDSHGIAV
jgi:hypothetical protein